MGCFTILVQCIIGYNFLRQCYLIALFYAEIPFYLIKFKFLFEHLLLHLLLFSILVLIVTRRRKINHWIKLVQCLQCSHLFQVLSQFNICNSCHIFNIPYYCCLRCDISLPDNLLLFFLLKCLSN